MSDQVIIDCALAVLEKRLKKPEFIATGTKDVKSYLTLKFAQLEYESFRVMFLNSQHEMISLKEMFRGTINESAVYPREVVKAALEFNAAAVILSHNHPSGYPNPSETDKQITDRLVKALKLVDIRVLDHFVIGDNEAYSFTEHGLL